MDVVQKKLSEIIPYDKNAKKHDKKQIDNVAESIRQYGFVQPIVIDHDGVIVIGHCRALAAKKLKMQTVPCVCVDDLTPEQVKALRLVDNKSNESEWDLNFLAEELELADLSEFDFDWDYPEAEEAQTDAGQGSTITHDKLSTRFIVPPFSILNSSSGEWQDRKKQWLAMGLDSGTGRDAETFTGNWEKYDYGIAPRTNTSIFDPVLCEIMYKWFSTESGSVLDPFAGGSVRGLVAEATGHAYTGIDLRQEQIDANLQQAKKTNLGSPEWICGDSVRIKDLAGGKAYDMIFSCPPYADLEVYSDDPRDLSTMQYADFVAKYREIIKNSISLLKNDRFAVFVVGDVRDKKGFYRDFVSDTKRAFIDAGAMLYNEIIKIDPYVTAGIRAASSMANRKVVKVHQNVLVFYKGNPHNIKSNFPQIETEETTEP